MAVLLLAGPLCGLAPAAGGESSAWLPVSVNTRDGSRLLGLARVGAVLRLRSAAGAMEMLAWKDARRVRFGRRIAPELESKARAAIADLRSETDEHRRKALLALTDLGPFAGRGLRLPRG